MRSHGTLIEWQPLSGSGWIELPRQAPRLAVDSSAFPADGIAPRVGELLSFEIELDAQGKPWAVEVQRARSRRRTRGRAPRAEPDSAQHSGLSRLWDWFGDCWQDLLSWLADLWRS